MSVQFLPTQPHKENTGCSLTKQYLSDGKQISNLSTYDHSDNIRNWISVKSVKGVQEKSDPDAKVTRNIYEPILKAEQTFVKDIDNFLSVNSLNQRRKKEILHKKWNEQVYEPLISQVEEIMASPYADNMKLVRDDAYSQYLDHRNRLGHVFLDIYDTEDYDPMTIRKFENSAGVKTRASCQSKDPLVSQEKNRREEDQTVIRCATGKRLCQKEYEASQMPQLPLVPLGRHGTGSQQWIRMPLGDIDSELREGSRKRMQGLMLKGEYDHRAWHTGGNSSQPQHWCSEMKEGYTKSQTQKVKRVNEGHQFKG